MINIMQILSIIGCVWFCISMIIGFKKYADLGDKILAGIGLFFGMPVLILLVTTLLFFIIAMIITALGF